MSAHTIRSMTGFGGAQAVIGNLHLRLEIRSVNSRYLEINCRLPDNLRYVEPLFREQITQHVARGKIDLRLEPVLENKQPVLLNEALKQRLTQWVQQFYDCFPNMPHPSLGELLALADKYDKHTNVHTPSNASREAMKTLCADALDSLNESRTREGLRLRALLQAYADQLSQYANAMLPMVPQAIEQYQVRLQQRLQETLDKLAPDGFLHIRPEELSQRLATESTVLAMRFDIAEEVERLRSHIQELRLICLEGSKGSIGKRLDFLMQEMQREVTTMGNKSTHASILDGVRDMKLIIEQIREQAQNIE